MGCTDVYKRQVVAPTVAANPGNAANAVAASADARARDAARSRTRETR